MHKLDDLKNKLKWYEERLAKMKRQAPKAGGRYGDEYLGEQIGVYEARVEEIREDILKLQQRI
jgi:hypothetical protein